MSFRLEGGRALEAALSELPRATAKNVGKRALMKAAEPILAAWKARTDVQTGALVASETIGTKLNKRQSRMNRKLDSKSAVEVHIGTSDPAGVLEEFGSIRNTPNPALRQAWEAEGGQTAVDRIGDELGKEIEKAAERARRRGGR